MPDLTPSPPMELDSSTAWHSLMRRLDMQLLLVFSTICRHGMLSAAATELNMSTSAVSHSVARLREIFGDPLFIRQKSGVSPSPLALTLLPKVNQILRLSNQIVDADADFDPQRSARWFTIGSSEFNEAAFGPRLYALCEREAPSIRIGFKVLTRDAIMAQVAAMNVDMAIGSFRGGQDKVEVTPLCSYGYVVVEQGARARQFGAMTQERYLASRHVNIAYESPPQAPIESLMTSLGHVRQVGANFPHFTAALIAVASSGLLMTVPRFIPDHFAEALDLQIHEFPFPHIKAKVSLLTHSLANNDPALKWLMQKIHQIAPSLND